MSAVNALDRLQAFVKDHPLLDLERAAAAMRVGPAARSGFDYEQAAAVLHEFPALSGIDDGPRAPRLRSIVSALVLHVSPTWRWLIPLGRGYLAGHLTADAKQVFDAAGLYGPADDPAVRAWWDGIAQVIRGTSADARLDVGRRGEDLSVAREIRVLAEADRNDLEPASVGFEDNTLGYDVRSFTIAGAEVRPKYIEVKSTENLPLRFYLSRGEWRAAERYGDDYFVHLWHLPSETLTEISFAQLSAHVPLDRGSGAWETTIIPWE